MQVCHHYCAPKKATIYFEEAVIVFFDLDNVLKRYEHVIDRSTLGMNITDIMSAKLHKRPKDGYKFLLYEDEDKQVPR